MCGIAGFTLFHNQVGNLSTLKAMSDAILHRGPDAGAEYLDSRIALCHRRLSIIDLSAAGTQPMHSWCENFIIVFNGEIYNFKELKQELIQLGHQFNSQTDTEVILALYKEFGVKLLDKINGMFAFALWDKEQQTLFIARDRIGKKPLYYSVMNQELLFASELKSLLRMPNISKEIRTDAVYDFFAYQYVPDPKTIFKNIYKLEPGHYLLFDKSGLTKQQYWDISFATQSKNSLQQNTQLLKEKLSACTKSRMIADVPLGAFLSGGVDSSAIVALMSKNSEKAPTTCSIGFNQDEFDETEYAQQVATQYQTNHFQFKVGDNALDQLEHIVKFFDEPFADPSLVPTYYVAKLAREKVTVALAGDGGDEVFAGYEKYKIDAIENKLRNAIPTFVRHKIFPGTAKAFKKINNSLCQKASSLLYSLSLEPDQAFYVTNAQITDNQWSKLANQQTKNELGSYHPAKISTDFYNQCDGLDHLAKILYTDLKTYLPGDILVKVDRMSMANSLEVRAPILDYKIIEFAATLPAESKFKDDEKKYILKQAFQGELSDDILYRKKMGFSPPLANWLRNELKDLASEKLLNRSQGLVNYFNLDVIKKYWQAHQDQSKDHSSLLWSMLMFQLWWDHYMEGA